MPRLKIWNVPFVINGTICITAVDKKSAVSLVEQMDIKDLINKTPVLHLFVDKTQPQVSTVVEDEPKKHENIFTRIWRRITK